MCKNKTDTKDLKAAKEEKIRTYLQVSLKWFTATTEIKNKRTLLSRFKAKPPLCLAFFSSLTVTPECKQETPSILCFFYSASLAFFPLFFCSLSAIFCSLSAAPVRSLEGLIYSLNMSPFRKDSMH